MNINKKACSVYTCYIIFIHKQVWHQIELSLAVDTVHFLHIILLNILARYKVTHSQPPSNFSACPAACRFRSCGESGYLRVDVRVNNPVDF